ncbi:CHASE domain-containing protein [Candidatus Parcubacteria bacterium]|nr:CHASE domain-containing protein [Candidatus Parcubacteria bacterium]
MFYIDTRFRSWLRKEIAIGHVGPTLIVFAAFIGLTIWTSIAARHEIEENQRQILNENLKEKEQNLKSKLSTYEDILRAGKGLFGASNENEVTRQEWKRFISSFELSSRYSGVQAVGYAQAVPQARLQSFIQSVRSQDLSSYSVYPPGTRSLHVNILYLESTDTESNAWKKAIGYDVYTNEVRRKAMDTARDNGEPVITDVTSPLRTNAKNADSTLVMYMPVYSGGSTPATPGERRRKLDGFVFADFFTNNLLSDEEVQDDNFGFRIYDGDINENSLMYQSPFYNDVSSQENEVTASTAVQVKNQQWQIVGSVSPDVISRPDRARPVSILWGGALFSIFVAGFIYLLLLHRSRVTFEEEQKELQDAKDELLALASHQLRTPATGVKQYIGLLRDGYAGPLDREQKKYVNKAYENNERQLATINKMLFVARANAKKIELNLEQFDIKALVKSTLDEMKERIKENEQKLHISLPERKTYIVADSKYLRMCLENVISNASKYTPEKGRITLTLKKSRQNIIIAITDSGVGVAEKDYPLLFRKFSRIPNKLTDKISGSGIGLYLANKVVEAHGGTIDFESKLGVGTTFTIKLPAKQKN